MYKQSVNPNIMNMSPVALMLIGDSCVHLRQPIRLTLGWYQTPFEEMAWSETLVTKLQSNPHTWIAHFSIFFDRKYRKGRRKVNLIGEWTKVPELSGLHVRTRDLMGDYISEIVFSVSSSKNIYFVNA